MKQNDYVKTIMNEKIARDISLWKYEGSYEIYNLLSYEEMKLKNYGMVNPQRYNDFVCYLKNDEVIGYTSMKKLENDKLYFGIGLFRNECKPICCGDLSFHI